MIIAVTRNDEINMLICQIAYSIFNVQKKIARIRSQDYLNPKFTRVYNKENLPIDVIISPPTSSPAPRDLNSTGDKRFQAPWTLSGLPAITFPIGTSKLGLPIGTQLIGENLSETKLLQSSLWCYETIGKNLNPDFSNFL